MRYQENSEERRRGSEESRYDRGGNSYREYDDRRMSRKRSKSRSRSRSRSYDRDRYERNRNRDRYEEDHTHRARRDHQPGYGAGGAGAGDGNRESNQNYWKNSEKVIPTSTVVVKGLPPRTTEPTLYALMAPYGPQNIRLISQRETGECKGYAFVEFFSAEYAQYFMEAFAGSCGDEKSPQFTVENRAVTLEYARESIGTQSFGQKKWSGEERPKKESGKSDWLCEQCNCQNFSRRVACYRCGNMRGENSVAVTATLSSDPYADVAIVSTEACSTLAVRGLPSYMNETQITDLFRQFAPVKSVFLVRDPKSGMSRGIAFVEFFSTEYSNYVLSNTTSLEIESKPLKIHYAKKSFLQSLPSFQQQQMLLSQYAGAGASATYNFPSVASTSPLTQAQHQAYAAAALQAAQWSSSYNPGTLASTIAIAPKVKSSWPLLFETNGASYIYQQQSGLFYDCVQRYFYCTKSKQYYNEVDGTYWIQSQPGDKHPFTQFYPPEPDGAQPLEEEQPSQEKTPTSENQKSSQGRKPVVLSMNLSASSKSKITQTSSGDKKSEPEVEVVAPAVVLTSMKKVSQNIAKWGERQSELAPEAPKEESQQKPSAGGSNVICTLCRRQFTTPELLQRHEKESKLHAENLAKLKATTSDSEPVVYRDRASERRAIHGQSEIPEDILEPGRHDEVFNSDRRKRRATSITDLMVDQPVGTALLPPAPVPVLSEDVANPGNQLLRRMGWSDGKGLGKDATGRVESIAESVAAASRVQSTAGVGVAALPPSSDFKSSLKQRTMARYEQINNSKNI